MRFAILLAVAFAFLTVGSLRADEGKDKKQGARGDREGRRAELIKKFDKDNSGDLDQEERAAARAAFEKRRGEGDGQRRRPSGLDRAALLKKFDKDESGDLNDEERAALKKHLEEMRAKRGDRPTFDREKIIAEFDKDKDGKLNEEERTAARAAMKERFQKRRAEGGEGRPGPRRQGKGEGQPRKKRPAQ